MDSDLGLKPWFLWEKWEASLPAIEPTTQSREAEEFWLHVLLGLEGIQMAGVLLHEGPTAKLILVSRKRPGRFGPLCFFLGGGGGGGGRGGLTITH